jgi:hypothetical protein
VPEFKRNLTIPEAIYNLTSFYYEEQQVQGCKGSFVHCIMALLFPSLSPFILACFLPGLSGCPSERERNCPALAGRKKTRGARKWCAAKQGVAMETRSVGDPDPHVFGPPDPLIRGTDLAPALDPSLF